MCIYMDYIYTTYIMCSLWELHHFLACVSSFMVFCLARRKEYDVMHSDQQADEQELVRVASSCFFGRVAPSGNSTTTTGGFTNN